jgi:hypothetical protein
MEHFTHYILQIIEHHITSSNPKINGAFYSLFARQYRTPRQKHPAAGQQNNSLPTSTE